MTVPSTQTREETERQGKIWAIGFGVVAVAVIAFIATRDPSHEPTAAEQQADAQRACQEKFIPARLKAPATAQFVGVSVSELSGSYAVTGSVDSQNSFGALVRSSFTCTIHSDGDKWVLDSATVG